MIFPAELQSYNIYNTKTALYAPAPKAVQDFYCNNKDAAYWAQVWPAAIGICMFLQQHPQYIIDKQVLELAAGLGLPGLYAAPFAKQVTISDKEAPAANYVKKSAKHLQLNNVTAKTLNWKDAPAQPLPDVVLLSDVNYEPAVFAELKKVVAHFLQHNVTVIISTPQRLVAKEFITPLLPYAVLQWHDSVLLNNTETSISIFVLKLELSSLE